MTDYDFSTLNDKEFENLAMDLISRDRGKRFERFKVGKDGGVDGRFYSEDNTEEIVQCKHYLKTGYKGLISSLRKKDGNEKDKVIKLNPEKYIFVTSLPLGRKEKEEFKEIFEPFYLKEGKMNKTTLTFTDFCSEIRRGRIGLENLSMTCLGFSEIDKDAEITYQEFFGKDER